ncbi:MAG TPA: AraC family transcriptional regulator [Stellaceae bacterium]|nr:AraC family transcriptional regulator [Stellaceae bacterium]
MPLARNDHLARVTNKPPVFEQILTDASESFLWRLDDYPWERNVWNAHPEYEIHLVRNAAGIALIGDHIGEFKPGHLTIVGSGLPHDWVTKTAPGELIHGRDIVVQFDPERLRKTVATLPELAAIESFLTLALRGLSFHGETRRIAIELLEEMGHVRGLSRLSLFLQLLDLLARSGEYEILSSEGFSPNLDSETVDIVQHVLAYVLENFTEDIKLRDLANVVGMNESTFSRFFKRNIGNSFSDHVTKLRIGRACKLLADDDMPITDVCFEAGYANISNFNRIFRKQRHITPSSYRRLAQSRHSG